MATVDRPMLGPATITVAAAYAEAAVLWFVLRDSKPAEYVFAVSIASFLLAEGAARPLSSASDPALASRRQRYYLPLLLFLFVDFMSVVSIAATRSIGDATFWSGLEWVLLAVGAACSWITREVVEA